MKFDIGPISMDGTSILEDIHITVIPDMRRAQLQFNVIDGSKKIPVNIMILHISDIQVSLGIHPQLAVSVIGMNAVKREAFSLMISWNTAKQIAVVGKIGVTVINIELNPKGPMFARQIMNLVKKFI